MKEFERRERSQKAFVETVDLFTAFLDYQGYNTETELHCFTANYSILNGEVPL